MTKTRVGIIRARKRTPYEEKDGRKLLQFIRRYRLHFFIKGNTIWKTAEITQILPRRWQSMREHFTKTVYPSILRGEIRYSPNPFDSQQFLILQDRLVKRRKLHEVPVRIINGIIQDHKESQRQRQGQRRRQ